MANRERGEVEIQADGTTYRLHLTTNALAELEDRLSTPEKMVTFAEVLERAAKGSIRDMRWIIWASLRKHHRELDVEDAGQLIDASGGIHAFAGQLGVLQQSATPDPRDVEELNVRPRKARARGTGEKPNSSPAATA